MGVLGAREYTWKMVGDVASGLGVRRTRTLVVDDHALYRLGLRTLVHDAPDIEVVGEAGTVAEALAVAAHDVPDLAIVDLYLPGQDGIALIQAMRARYPGCAILAVSGETEPLIIARALEAGANGFVLKTEGAAELLAAIRAVRRGVRYISPAVAWEAAPADLLRELSAREREILEQLVLGQSNDDIATALFISRRTVEKHRQRVMRKLGAHTIADLVLVASRHGVGRR